MAAQTTNTQIKLRVINASMDSAGNLKRKNTYINNIAHTASLDNLYELATKVAILFTGNLAGVQKQTDETIENLG